MGRPPAGLIDDRNPVNRSHPANRGLVAWWLPQAKQYDPLTFRDISGNGFNGTLHGSPIGVDKETLAGGVFLGLNCNGSGAANGYADCGNAGNGLTAVTVGGWVKHNAVPTLNNYQHYAVKPAGATWVSPYAVWAIRAHNDTASGSQPKVAAWINNGGTAGDYAFSATVLAANVWYHVAMTYDGVTLKVYVMGKQEGSATVSASLSTSTFPLYLGQRTAGSGDFMNGQLYDWRVNSAALSAAEVWGWFQESHAGNPNTLNRWPPRGAVSPPATGNRRRRVLICGGN